MMRDRQGVRFRGGTADLRAEDGHGGAGESEQIFLHDRSASDVRDPMGGSGGYRWAADFQITLRSDFAHSIAADALLGKR